MDEGRGIYSVAMFQRLFAKCEEPFFCSFELTLQSAIFLLQ